MSPIPELSPLSSAISVSLPIITVLQNDIGTVQVEGYAEPMQSIVQVGKEVCYDVLNHSCSYNCVSETVKHQ